MDLISRQAAIDAEGEESEIWFEDDNDYDLGRRAQWRLDVGALQAVPSAEPEIIYCKDCKKQNVTTGLFMDICPLALFRGIAQGHEFDYQFCAYAERRTDE